MTIEKKYQGVIVPMISPIQADMTIDSEAVSGILYTFLETKVDPFLLGTTGESVSLSEKQKIRLVETVANEVKGKCIIYAGISGNSITASIDEALKFYDLGADAVVAHLPFYYPIEEAEMLKYYEQLANAVPCPLFLYNNPITTKISIPLEVIEKLSHHPNIAGVKDSERGMERLDASLKMCKNRDDFSFLLGWAAQSAYAVLNGGDGIVPSTANLTPGFYRDLYSAAKNGDEIKALELQEKTDRISEIYQKDRKISQAIPALKRMMSYYGLCEPHVMPPMYLLGEEDEKKIKNAMVAEMGELI